MPETIRRRPEGHTDDTRTNVRWSEHEYAALKAAAELAGETNTTRFVRTKLLEAIGYMAPEQAAPEVPWEVGDDEATTNVVENCDTGDEAVPASSPRPAVEKEEAPARAAARSPKSRKRKPARSKPKTRSPVPPSAVVSGAEAAPTLEFVDTAGRVIEHTRGIARALEGIARDAWKRAMKR